MPKIKSVRGAAKRFKATGSGKLKRKKANLRHILTKKSSKRKRHLGEKTTVHAADLAATKKMLGGKISSITVGRT